MTVETIGPGLVIASLAAVSARGCRFRPATAAAAALLVGCAAFVPVHGISVAGYALALSGALSAATLVLCAQLLLRALAGADSRTNPSDAFVASLVAAGLLLYPMATGLVPFDSYDLGFRGLSVPALMALFVVVGWRRDAPDVSAWIAGSALLYALGAYSSVNMWDYLIDPIGVLAALAILAARTWRRFRQAGPIAKTPPPPVHRRSA